MNASAVITIGGVSTHARVNTLAWVLHSACDHLDQHDGYCSSCCLSKSKTKNKNVSAKVIKNEIDSFFRMNCRCLRTGHCAWPHHLFPEVIALAIILLVVGLVAPHVLVIVLRATVAPIVLIIIVGSFITAVVSVASMIVAIFTTTILMVAWFTARCDRKLSHFPFLWLLVLGNLLKNASHLVGCLTLLEEGNHLEWVSGHHLV